MKMKKSGSRFLSMLMTLVMVLSLTPNLAFAEEAAADPKPAETEVTETTEPAPTDPAQPAETVALSVSDIKDDSVTLNITNNGATEGYPYAYYLVKKAGEAAPDAAEIKTANNMVNDYNFIQGTTSTASQLYIDVTPGTEYDAYAVLFYGNQTPTNVAKASFNTTGTPQAATEFVTLSYTSGTETVSTNYKEVADLGSALAAVPADAKDIKMTLTDDKNVVVPSRGTALMVTRDCTLDLNGHVLMTRSTGSQSSVLKMDAANGNFTFTLEDTSSSKDGVLLNDADGPTIDFTWAGSATFIMNSGTVKSTHILSGSDRTAIAANGTPKLQINGGNIFGTVSLYGTMEMNDGLIQAAFGNGVVIVQRSARFNMNGGTIYNSDDKPGRMTSAVVTNMLENSTLENPCFKMNGGTLSSDNGPALYFEAGGFSFSDTPSRYIILKDAVLKSKNNVAIGFNYTDGGNITDTNVLNVSGNTVLKGNKAAINLTGQGNGTKPEDSSNRKFWEINIADTVKVQYGQNGLFAIPNTSCLSLPEGKVLNVKADADGAYSFANKEDLKQTIDNIQYSYQNMDRLNTTIASAKEIYEAGNADGTYDATLWEEFVKAYKAALPIPTNANANQNEIDHFADALSVAQSAMVEQAQNGVDVSKLADGKYTVQLEMRIFNDEQNRLSMCDGAFGHTANLTMKDGKGTLEVDMKPIQVATIYGSLMQYWVYDAPTPAEAKAAVAAGTNREDVNYLAYNNVDVNTGKVTPIEGTPSEKPAATNSIRPAKLSFALPYMGASNNQNEVYGRVSVDAMSGEGGPGDQDVTMYIKYHTLKAIDVKTSLIVSADELNMKPDTFKTVTAEVLGPDAEGYAITWASDNEAVATVEDGMVLAHKAGTANITATAAKEGAETLTRTIKVTVADAAFEQAKADLKADLDAAKKIEKGEKTADAYTDLQAAVKKAEAAYNSANATTDSLNKEKAALADAVKAFNASADFARPVIEKNTEGTVTLTMRHEYQKKDSMCNVFFAEKGNVKVNEDGTATLEMLVAYPIPAFPEEGKDGTLTNFKVTYNGKQYDAVSDIKTKPLMTTKKTNDQFGLTAGEEIPAQVLTVTLPMEALAEEYLVVNTHVNVVMNTDVEFRMFLSEMDLKPSVDPDAAAAQAVIDKIAAIGEVTLESEAAIKDARAAYDALTPAQKELVTNADVLIAAEKALDELKQPEKPEAPQKFVVQFRNDRGHVIWKLNIKGHGGIFAPIILQHFKPVTWVTDDVEGGMEMRCGGYLSAKDLAQYDWAEEKPVIEFTIK